MVRLIMGEKGTGKTKKLIELINATAQEDMQKAQQEVEEKTFSASVGGGVVSAEVNGKKEVTGITIKPEAVDPEDVEMLQDLILSAVNEALRQAEEAMDGKMNALTSGLGLGGFGF